MKTLNKTLDVLEVFLNKGEEVGISELVNITGHNISTIHSILSDLIKRGYILQKNKRSKYSLGLKFLSLSSTINRITAIKELVYPFMVELNRQTNETVNTLILDGNNTISIGGITSTQQLRVVLDDKMGAPLYCTGSGKIFLAGMAETDLDNYFKRAKLISYTPKTVTDVDKLKRQLNNIKRKGIACESEEYQVGLTNVACPINDYDKKPLAALSVIAPTVRLNKNKIREITPLLKKYSSEISKLLGTI